MLKKNDYTAVLVTLKNAFCIGGDEDLCGMEGGPLLILLI